MESILLILACAVMALAAIVSFIFKKYVARKKLCNILWSTATLLISFCIFKLLFYLVSGDYSIAYTANHTNATLPVMYKISALWAGQEGSLMLWAFFLCITGFFVLNSKRNSGKSFGAFAVIGFAIAVMCCFSNPFLRLNTIPTEGAGLNAALQDPWMAVHPPLVFIAYSILAALFSFSVENLENNTAQCIYRKWMLAGFVFLGAGIFTGCIWAYRALGWGGYWSWDPIENAALVPWLLLCAFLHDKGKLTRTRMMLPFILAIFGTFLIRSGILSDLSVHAYAQGNWAVNIVILLLIAAACVFILFGKPHRNKKIKKDRLTLRHFKNPILLFCCITYVYAAVVFLATLSPLLLGITANAGFYNAISIAYLLGCLVCLVLEDFMLFKKMIFLILLAATLLCVLFILFFHKAAFLWLVLLWLMFLPLCLLLFNLPDRKKIYFNLMHIGFLIFAIGILTSSAFQIQGTAFSSGSTININGNTVDIGQGITTKIVSFLSYDIVIKQDAAIPFFTYTIKPLIWLFWLGGGALACLPLVRFITFRKLFVRKKEELPGPEKKAH